MPVPVPLLLGLAGIGAGLMGSVAGLASLVSYPALLAAGLPPVTANVTNTVALVGSSVGSVLGSRVELHGQAPRLRRLGPAAVAGGAAGAALLLLTPPGAFALVVPWLIALASVVILLQPQQRAWSAGSGRLGAPGLSAGVLVVGVYGGYFGAAAGVLLLALLLAGTGDTLARSNATKNVVLGLANAVAALGFGLFATVRWSAAVPLALGFLVGGRLGPAVVRRVPVRGLRVAIGLAGLGLAAYLWRSR